LREIFTISGTNIVLIKADGWKRVRRYWNLGTHTAHKNEYLTLKFEKEGIMKARNCCKTMQAELTAWKANVYDIVRKMEELPGGEREKILPNIEDLHMLIGEMDDRIEQILANCTPETGIDDIRTDREEFDKHLASLRVTADEAMKGLGGGNFGG
jgi:hypothetical protein